MNTPLFDAHLHLAAKPLLPQAEEICRDLSAIGVQQIVCNGTGPDDWPDVLALGQLHPLILPAIGLHPWKVPQAGANWKARFLQCLDEGAAAVGEIGLDQWIENHDIQLQQDAFRFQLAEAARRNLPVSIHCLKATGPLMETLRSSPLPARGFHLHAYNGPSELLDELLSLGAFFSFNAGQLKPGRKRILDNLHAVPLERLLIETDAPDFLPLPKDRTHNLTDPESNHPANLAAGYRAVAQARGMDAETMAAQVADNFQGFFGK